MSQWSVLLLSAGLLACSNFYHEEPCGRQRSVTVQDTLVGAARLGLYLLLVDEEKRPDVFSWEITLGSLSDDVTAVHLHDRTPGNNARMLYDFTTTDADPGPDFHIAGGGYYSFTTSIDNLLDLVRSGSTYIDVHTDSHPEGEVRADITEVQFEDWSGYFCS